MLRPSSAFFAAFLLAAACASNPAPAPGTAAGAPAGSAGSATPDQSQAQGGDAKPKADNGWPDSQREPFMRGCVSKVKAPDYCACGWDQFRDVFKDAYGQDPPPSDPRFKTLEERTKAACASKLPEDIVKASFISSCVEDDKRKASYCECAWPALRKSLAVSDFTTDFQGPRFDEAKKAMVAACKGKFPTEVAKADFLKGCTKDDPGNKKMCDCAWKKLRAKFSTEEIVAGVIDANAAGVASCK
jgi:hypothetical protein